MLHIPHPPALGNYPTKTDQALTFGRAMKRYPTKGPTMRAMFCVTL